MSHEVPGAERTGVVGGPRRNCGRLIPVVLGVILAHFGHWWSSLVFAVPFLVLVGLLTAGRLYDRRRDRRDDPDQSPSP
ncbi:MAG TPA: hypothetical protein VGN69_07225 [Solirubrobacteraceae bacterium]|nr:hypothetical protein [Solirubrobacteraceae bacterium]